MSALPPKADMCSALAYVCFGPIADIDRLLFDDLVGSREQRGRHGQAKSLRCLQVYDEFVFAWSLHRQIGRFLAFQYAINVSSGPSILIIKIRPIRNQPAGDNKRPLNLHRGEFIAGRGCDD
jgi:hypothetical protein